MKINKLIIHCSATQAKSDIGAKEIREWHMTGNKWADIGYHYVIRRDGRVEKGRSDLTVGAHCQGHNTGSFGICLVGGLGVRGNGENNFTEEQFKALTKLVKALVKEHPGAEVYGHRDLNRGKECPCFDAKEWWKSVNE